MSGVARTTMGWLVGQTQHLIGQVKGDRLRVCRTDWQGAGQSDSPGGVRCCKRMKGSAMDGMTRRALVFGVFVTAGTAAIGCGGWPFELSDNQELVDSGTGLFGDE